MNPILELRKKFDLNALTALINGSVRAVRVADYADDEACTEITRRMLASSHYGNYANAPLIGRSGTAFYETTHNLKAALAYLEAAPAWMDDMRVECAPYASPIDQCRLQADVIWPGGARVARLHGRPLFVGLLRNFRPGSEAEAHQDHLDWDADSVGMHEGAHMDAQLAANVYLQVPPEGGELVIWPTGLSKTDYERFRNPGSYGVRESALVGDPLVIKPRRGELIFFNSRNTHAVRAPVGGNRVTWSCFIGCNGQSQPLAFWS